MKEQYLLPMSSAGSDLDRPALNVQVKAEKVKTIGGFRKGVKATLWAITHPINLVRLLPSALKRPSQKKGIPPSKRRRPTAFIAGRRNIEGAFVERGRGKLQVFRRKPGSRKPKNQEVMERQAVPSAHEILDRPENQRRLEEVAVKTFEKEFMRNFK